MNGTPRLRSAFPTTPRSDQKLLYPNDSSARTRGPRSPLPDLAPSSANTPAPAIPCTVLDAPSQRLYVSMLYISLISWRLYDYFWLVSGDEDGFWLFTKWVGIDFVFLYVLAGLRIPWLQWSSTTFTILFIGHSLLNWMLMFCIPIPLLSWLGVLTKVFWDRELAVAERSVKPASVLHNSSLILGKQIIHILPEGSAMLNPDGIPSCIGGPQATVTLPIHINQTNPVLIELLRVDIETNGNKTIVITAKEIKKLKREADKEYDKNDYASPRLLRYPVRETGLYRLQRVVDESKLEVQRRISDTLVVRCPMAVVKPAQQHKCRGDLSDFYLQVYATPPFKIRYSKTVNGDNHGHAVLSIHPENLVSPLGRQRNSGALVPLDPSATMDVSWARAQSIQIPLNESLGVSGEWKYVIDEVHDACGNIANYSDSRSSDMSQQRSLKENNLEQHFFVHERPKVALLGCDSQHPIKVQRGRSTALPIQLGSTGSGKPEDISYSVSYLFTDSSNLLPDQKHSQDATLHEIVLKDRSRELEVRDPGLYTLQSISSDFCGGEVLEPSSCLLENPDEPELAITSENIPDRCAGNSVGLLVDLHLLGTPPFHVFYNVEQRGGGVTPRVVDVDRFHTQLELRPSQAGHYTYEFLRISDAVYSEPRSPRIKIARLETDVKPPAAARILDAQPIRKACIEEPVTFVIQILGEPPFSIDYEIVHRGHREKKTAHNIERSIFELTTDPLTDGGEYALALISITDESGCKTALKDEAKVDVGLQRPKASFGHLEGKRSISALESKKISLPLRLQGEAPWTLKYRNLDDKTGTILERRLCASNDKIDVDAQGTYEIIDLHDATCPGSIDLSANKFSVQWVSRPAIKVVESLMIELVRDIYVKKEVCEGDEDATEISFTGSPPFNVEYEQRHKPDHGSQSMSVKKFNAGLNLASLHMDTSQAGSYEYKFSKLGDNSYNHDPRKFSPLIVQQRVNPRPSAHFTQAGKSYKYCQEEESGGEMVPITLKGLPPFRLELELKHHATTKPELIDVPYIELNYYNLHIPHRVLALGTHSVTIRKVQDSRGCKGKLDYNAPHVQVSVADIPRISPLEDQVDYCIGDRISYALSGTPPFNVFYTFQGLERKATVHNTDFRRLAEKPGVFVITALSDHRSTDACKAKTQISKVIHEMPSVRVSKGRTATVDIHEGGEAEMLFEFGGTPPFHFTYIRSTTTPRGKRPEVLETKNEISYEYSKTVRASDEGTYEVVSIRDKYCSFSTQKARGKSGQKLIANR